MFESVTPAVAAAEEAAHHSVGLEIGMAAVSVAIAVIGFLVAYTTYAKKSDRAERVATQFKGLYQALLNKWYVDELYDATLCESGEGSGPWLVAFRRKDRGRSREQHGSQHGEGCIGVGLVGSIHRRWACEIRRRIRQDGQLADPALGNRLHAELRSRHGVWRAACSSVTCCGELFRSA